MGCIWKFIFIKYHIFSLYVIKILFYRWDAQIFANFISDDVADFRMPWD